MYFSVFCMHLMYGNSTILSSCFHNFYNSEQCYVYAVMNICRVCVLGEITEIVIYTSETVIVLYPCRPCRSNCQDGV